MNDINTRNESRDDRFRRLEREWQNEFGQHLLDVPHELEGSAKVFEAQFRKIIDRIDLETPGKVVEIGCGKGHFLAQLKRAATEAKSPIDIIGIDVSEAVDALPDKSLDGVCADGEALPFADGSLKTVIYDGALHHLIDYEAAVCEAYRVLEPGGRMILFEPVSSIFSRTVHRVLDPFIFEEVEYESPIDQEYKDHFREDRVMDTLKGLGMAYTYKRSDFLAYPLTGCYAGSFFCRFPKFMGFLLGFERFSEKIPILKQIAAFFSWRFLLVAEKPAATSTG